MGDTLRLRLSKAVRGGPKNRCLPMFAHVSRRALSQDAEIGYKLATLWLFSGGDREMLSAKKDHATLGVVYS